MKKLASCIHLLQRFIWILFLAMTGAIILLQNIGAVLLSYAGKKEFALGNALLLALGAALFLLYAFLCFKCSRKGMCILERCPDKTILFVSVLWFFFQVGVCFQAYFYTGWDVGKVLLPNVSFLATGQIQALSNDYFSSYPNNILLLLLFAGIRKVDLAIGILDSSRGIMGLLTVQCLLSTLTGLILYQVVRDLCGKVWAWTAWFFYGILLGTSGWLMIPYSDSMGLIFPILILRLYLSIRALEACPGTKGATRKLCIRWFAIGLAAYWGFQIKPQVLIIVIAILLSQLLERLRGLPWKPFALSCGCMALAFLLSFPLFTLMRSTSGLDIDPQKQLGIPHYLMMGLNGPHNGSFLSEDVLYSQSFPDRKGREAAQWLKIRERLKEMGASGLSGHLARKTLCNFADGTFAWKLEGDFFLETYEYKNTVLSPALCNLIWGEGRANRLFEAIKQAAWLLVLFLSAALAGRGRRLEEPYFTVMLSLIGITLFVTLFEARARYLFLYAPIYIVAAMAGAQHIFAAWQEEEDPG